MDFRLRLLVTLRAEEALELGMPLTTVPFQTIVPSKSMSI